ncbi:hypothetical protein AgCh_031395 [Apium graveolens]
MDQSERNLSPRKDSKPPHFKYKFPRSTSSPSLEHVRYKSSTNTSSTAKRMDGKPPVGIGTKGTVGSLILQEIEYYRQLQINCRDTSQREPEPQIPSAGSTISFCKPNLGSSTTTPTKKKKGSNRIIPSMCSMVDIVEKNNQPHLSSRFSYRVIIAISNVAGVATACFVC